MHPTRSDDETLGDMEDKWWVFAYSVPNTYCSLPETLKWLCRIEVVPTEGPSHLKVIAAGDSYIFSLSHISIFMLLKLQQLSSLDEAIRLPPGSSVTIWHLKNIHFLDELRICILTNNKSGEYQNEILDSYLTRWVLRLIHSIPNSKRFRRSNVQKVQETYKMYEKDDSWKIGESYLLLFLKIMPMMGQPSTSG